MWWFALAAVLLPTALLAVPLQVTIIGRPEAQLSVTFRLRWFFGLVQLRSDRDRGPQQNDKRKQTSGKSRRSEGQAGKGGLAYLRASGGAERILQIVKKLCRCLHPRLRGVEIEIGLGDPADTGMAWGLLGPLSAWLSVRFAGEAAVLPNFFEERLSLTGEVQFTLVPLQALLPLLAYLASPRTIRGLIAAREAMR